MEEGGVRIEVGDDKGGGDDALLRFGSRGANAGSPSWRFFLPPAK